MASVGELEEDIQAMEAATTAAHATLKQSLDAVERCGGEGAPSLQLRSAVERVVRALETVMLVEGEEEEEEEAAGKQSTAGGSAE